MADIATLGLRVERQQAVEGRKALDELTASGIRAEKATDALARSTDRAAQRARLAAEAERDYQRAQAARSAEAARNAAQSAVESARAAADGFQKAFEERAASIRFQLVQGLLTPAQARKAGEDAAREFNLGMVQVMQQAQGAGAFRGAEGRGVFTEMAGQLKTLDEGARKSGLGLARLNNSMVVVAQQTLRLNPTIGRLIDTVGTFAIGTAWMIPVLAGLAAIGLAWSKITEESRKAREELEKARSTLQAIKRENELGAGGEAGAAATVGRAGRATIGAENARRSQALVVLESQNNAVLGVIAGFLKRRIDAEARAYNELAGEIEAGERAAAESRLRVFREGQERLRSENENRWTARINELKQQLAARAEAMEIADEAALKLLADTAQSEEAILKERAAAYQNFVEQVRALGNEAKSAQGWQALSDVTGGPASDTLTRNIEGLVQAWAAMPASVETSMVMLDTINQVLRSQGKEVSDLSDLWQEYINKITKAAGLKPVAPSVSGGSRGVGITDIIGGMGGVGQAFGIASAAFGALKGVDAIISSLLSFGKASVAATAAIEKAAKAEELRTKAANEFWETVTDFQTMIEERYSEARASVDEVYAWALQTGKRLNELAEARRLDEGLPFPYMEELVKATHAYEDLAKATKDAADAAEEAARAQRELQGTLNGLIARGLSATGRGAAGARMGLAFQQSVELYNSRDQSPEVLALLRFVQAAEVANLENEIAIQAIRDAAEAQLAALADQQEIAEAQLRVAQDQLRAQQQAVEVTRRLVESLAEFNQGLLTGPLTTLSPAQQLKESRSQFETMAALALAGDLSAAQSLTGTASTFLDASRGYNASSTGFVEDFGRVRSVIEAVQKRFEGQLTVEERMLAQLETQTSSLQKQLDAIEKARAQAEAEANAQIMAIQDAHNGEMDRLYDILQELIAQTRIMDGFQFNDVPPTGEWEWDPVTKTWRRKGDGGSAQLSMDSVIDAITVQGNANVLAIQGLGARVEAVENAIEEGAASLRRAFGAVAL